jgi:hypothetical protein
MGHTGMSLEHLVHSRVRWRRNRTGTTAIGDQAWPNHCSMRATVVCVLRPEGCAITDMVLLPGYGLMLNRYYRHGRVRGSAAMPIDGAGGE